jgi:superfamily II DNA/RNA helicase
VFDMISRKVLRTTNIKMFVLDEADEMLSRWPVAQYFFFLRHRRNKLKNLERGQT